jgi:hypothetical protein
MRRARPTALTALTAGLLVALPAAASRRLPSVLAEGNPPFQVRPAMISYTGDGTGFVGGLNGTSVRHLGRLRWATDNRTEGLAHGLLWLNNCAPSCAAGRFSSTQVHVRVSSPKSGRFRQLTLTYNYRGRHYVDRLQIHDYDIGGGGFWGYAVAGTQQSA